MLDINITKAVPEHVERTAKAIHQARLQVGSPNDSISWADLDSDEFMAEWQAIGQHLRSVARAQAVAALQVNGLPA